jgi:spermidine synthase
MAAGIVAQMAVVAASAWQTHPMATTAEAAGSADVAVVSRARLGAVVFTAGAGTLAVEIAASRLLAPYFGSSTIVWANVIGLILLYLSVGYWFGGRWADRRPDPRVLGRIVLVSALVIAVLPFVSRPVLDLTVRGLDAVSVGAVVGSFFAALALFAVPVTLLGTVSPFAIRLALGDVRQAGETAGRLYAVSTVGSILGTFLSAIVAIPLVGTQRTMLGTAALLVLAAALLLGRRWQLATLAVAGLVFVPVGAVKATDGLLWETESPYQYVQVVQRPDGSRVLRLNEGIVAHSVWRRGTVLTGGYWDAFLLVPPLLGRPVARVLVLGSAGGTIGRAYGRFYPRARIDGVEIDAKATEAGRRFLGLADNPNVHTVTADARPFLRETHERYDVIIGDAYRQPYVPFYLATREFFQLARAHLRPGGIVALNVATVPGDDALARALGSTLASVFPEAWIWRPLRFNAILLALDRPAGLGVLEQRVAGVDPALKPLVPVFDARLTRARVAEQPLTDDRAPVEWLTDRMFTSFVASGGELDTDLLPTRP